MPLRRCIAEADDLEGTAHEACTRTHELTETIREDVGRAAPDQKSRNRILCIKYGILSDEIVVKFILVIISDACTHNVHFLAIHLRLSFRQHSRVTFPRPSAPAHKRILQRPSG